MEESPESRELPGSSQGRARWSPPVGSWVGCNHSTQLFGPPGVHLVEVTYDDVPVPKSPFRVGVSEGCDPSRVRAYGPGLEGGLVNKANHFTVETR